MTSSRSGNYRAGHRVRVKERFFRSLFNKEVDFQDYELLELALFFAVPRKEVKLLAKSLLQKFSSLSGVLNSDFEQLEEINGVSKNIFLFFRLLIEIKDRVLRNGISKKDIIGSWNSLLIYLQNRIGGLGIEQFRILLLNKKNILLTDIMMTTGTIDKTAVYPREIVRKAIFYNAAAVILVHNHPSGDPRPSKVDIDMTKKTANACRLFDIVVHDHVIVTNSEVFSFKAHGLLHGSK